MTKYEGALLAVRTRHEIERPAWTDRDLLAIARSEARLDRTGRPTELPVYSSASQ